MIKTRRHDRVVRVDRRAVIGAAWRFDETRTPAMQTGLATRRLTLRVIFMSLRRVVWWRSDVLTFSDSRRTADAAVIYMPVAA